MLSMPYSFISAAGKAAICRVAYIFQCSDKNQNAEGPCQFKEMAFFSEHPFLHYSDKNRHRYSPAGKGRLQYWAAL
jgi:hypothetical protein